MVIMIINIGKHLGLGLRVSGLRFFRVLGVLGFRPSDFGFRFLHNMLPLGPRAWDSGLKLRVCSSTSETCAATIVATWKIHSEVYPRKPL